MNKIKKGGNKSLLSFFNNCIITILAAETKQKK